MERIVESESTDDGSSPSSPTIKNRLTQKMADVILIMENKDVPPQAGGWPENSSSPALKKQ